MFRYSDNFFKAVLDSITKFPDLLLYIRNKRYRISDTNLTYRQINSLGENKLVSDSRENDKNWRKFSLYDLFYLEIISQLRQFDTRNSKLHYLKGLFYEQELSDAGIRLLLGELALIGVLTGIRSGLVVYSSGKSIFTDLLHTSTITQELESEEETWIFVNLEETFSNILQNVKGLHEEIQDKFSLKSIKHQYYFPEIELSEKEAALLEIIRNKNK